MSTQDAERLAPRLDEDERYLRLMISVGERMGARAAPKDMADGYSLLMTILSDPDPQLLEVYEQCMSGTFMPPNDLHRLLREVAAKRRILALYREFAAEFDREREGPGGVGSGVHAATKVLGEVVAALAGVYEEAGETAG